MSKSQFNNSTIIPVNIGTFEAIRKQGGRRWMDALAIFQTYQYQALMQGTSSVYAADEWMAQQVGLSLRSFTATKPILARLGLIKTVRKFDKNNPHGKTFVQVRTLAKFAIVPDEDSSKICQTPNDEDSSKKGLCPLGRHSLKEKSYSKTEEKKNTEREGKVTSAPAEQIKEKTPSIDADTFYTELVGASLKDEAIACEMQYLVDTYGTPMIEKHIGIISKLRAGKRTAYKMFLLFSIIAKRKHDVYPTRPVLSKITCMNFPDGMDQNAEEIINSVMDDSESTPVWSWLPDRCSQQMMTTSTADREVDAYVRRTIGGLKSIQNPIYNERIARAASVLPIDEAKVFVSRTTEYDDRDFQMELSVEAVMSNNRRNAPAKSQEPVAVDKALVDGEARQDALAGPPEASASTLSMAGYKSSVLDRFPRKERMA